MRVVKIDGERGLWRRMWPSCLGTATRWTRSPSTARQHRRMDSQSAIPSPCWGERRVHPGSADHNHPRARRVSPRDAQQAPGCRAVRGVGCRHHAPGDPQGRRLHHGRGDATLVSSLGSCSLAIQERQAGSTAARNSWRELRRTRDQPGADAPSPTALPWQAKEDAPARKGEAATT